MLVGTLLGASMPGTGGARAMDGPPSPVLHAGPGSTALEACRSMTLEPPIEVVVGKARMIAVADPVVRLVVGGPGAGLGRGGAVGDSRSAGLPPVATAAGYPGMAPGFHDGVADVDVVLVNPTEIFLLGRRTGSMNLVLQGREGRCRMQDVLVTIDTAPLIAQLRELLPGETGVRVKAAENALVLSGEVSDATRLDQVMSLAGSFGDGKRMVNLLRVNAPQQVMLEVKIAEVSKTLIDKLGASTRIGRSGTSGDNVVSLVSNFLSNGAGLLQALQLGKVAIGLDGQKEDGLVRVLAEPNIMAISGQSASFLSGGKLFIPVAQTALSGSPAITLEEKEFGIGVKFTPTALDARRINLKLVSEVSDLSQTGSPFTTVNGVVSVIPTFTVRRADTTVQLNDGQSFVIAGLIKNNATEAVKRFPGLGEIPVLGALFRSSEFQKDQTELMFVVTPRMVHPLAEVPPLPTDRHILPSRADVYLNGSLEGSPSTTGPGAAPASPSVPAPAPAAVFPLAPAGAP